MIEDRTRRTLLKGLGSAGLASAIGLPLLSGCAKSGGDGGTPVRILSSQGTQVLTIQQLIADKGYFKDAKLDADVLPVASGTNIVGPLLNGSADICIFAGFSQLLAAIEKGAKLKILGGASIKGQQALFSKDPRIQTVQDLVGRSVGTGAVGAQLHQVVTALLKKKGIDPAKVTFVNVGSSNDVFRGVVAGRVDAGNGQADVLSSLQKLGVHMLKDGDYSVELPEYTWQASFTSIATLKTQRDALVRTLAVYLKAFRYVQDGASKEDYVQAALKALKPTDRAAAIEAAISQWNYLQERKIYAEDLSLSPERVRYMQELNIELGVQKKIMPYEQIIDTSVAKDAVARLG